MASEVKHPLLKKEFYHNCSGCRLELRKQTQESVPLRSLFSIWIIVLCNSLPISSLFPFLYFMIRDFHIAEREEDTSYYAGYVGSAFMLGRALTSVYWGMLSDRYGRKPIIVIGSISVVIFNTLFGLSVSFWMAVFTRFLLGAFNGLLGPIKAYASEVCRDEHQPVGLSTIATAWGIGLIIGPAVGGLLAQPAEKYPDVFTKDSLFGRFPYFLPCLCISAFALVVTIATFWLEESLHKHPKMPLVGNSCEAPESATCGTSTGQSHEVERPVTTFNSAVSRTEKASQCSHEPRADKMPLTLPKLQPSFLLNSSSFHLHSPRPFQIPRIHLSSRRFPAFKSTGFPFHRRNRSSTSISPNCNTSNDAVSEASGLSEEELNGGVSQLGAEELELLDKPLPSMKMEEDADVDVSEAPKPDKEEALAPFMKFFMPKEGDIERMEEDTYENEGNNMVAVEYYDPKPGDWVVGVVVYGNENKLDVNIGADLLGTMLTKEILPFYNKELDYSLYDLNKDCDALMENGRMGLVQNDEALSHHSSPGRPVVEAGTVLFAEVLGRTLSGRPLLSSRRLFRRIACHRVRQIKQINEPIQVKITEWNTGGLLTRIEGLRAFLPKAELVTRINNFSELKENVGRWIHVRINRINEETNDLILSEREAWEKVYLREGTLLEGRVTKIFPYGAQVRLGQTNRSGLLHMSNISRGKVTSVADLLEVDEKVKVLVLRSLIPGKISLSIAELESEPGLFISNKEKVFAEAEAMAKKYRQKRTFSPARKSESALPDSLPFDDESNLYANWAWFNFQKED